MPFRTLAAASVIAGVLSAPAAAQCFAAFEDEREPVPLDGYVLREEAAAPGPVARPPLPENANGLLCVRETVVPDANDFKILHHGMPLYIQTPDATLALGFQDGEYVVTLPQGSIRDDEREQIVAALEGFNQGEAELARWMEENQPEDAPER